jgi:hypothetical protein
MLVVKSLRRKEAEAREMIYTIDERQLLRVWSVICCFAEIRKIQDPIAQSENPHKSSDASDCLRPGPETITRGTSGLCNTQRWSQPDGEARRLATEVELGGDDLAVNSMLGDFSERARSGRGSHCGQSSNGLGAVLAGRGRGCTGPYHFAPAGRCHWTGPPTEFSGSSGR